MRSRFFVRSSKNSAGILVYVKEFWGKMTKKMQADDVLSRQAVFVRCCLIKEDIMNDRLKTICEQFIYDRDIVKSTFPWDSSYIIPLCAMALGSKNVEVTSEKLKACRRALEQHTSIFSNFRGNTKLPMVTILAGAEDPLDKMQAAMAIYGEMRELFYGSEYLAYISAVLTDMITREESVAVAKRSKEIYNRMKQEHPFLTSSEDSGYAVLLSFSEKSDDELIADMEQCYKLLKKHFHNSNPVQSVSHVLALGKGSAEEKCERLLALFKGLEKAKLHYSTYYELAVLAALSIQEVQLDTLIEEIREVDEFLSEQKGYGLFTIDRTTRLMHAVVLVSNSYMANSVTDAAAMNGTFSMIAAQQAAMCAIIARCASTAATSH